MLIKILILKIKKKIIPFIIFKLKSYYCNNRKNFIIPLIIALIIMFIFFASLLALVNLHDEEPNINIQGKPGPVAIL